ncbi:hypothetical protein BGX23_000430 [Mortierella sp. AD031]|nr:hypothetical protein BGX23_000430 [Mortierella sp. AD031]KAG0213855.1 hypothetical protein BGX33_002613 [Mortierella sp. NVP41]
MYTSSYIQQPFLPSSTPLHPAVPTISVEQVANTHTFVDSNILDYYLSSLESQHQHRQQPAQQPSLLATFESSLDLLMAPHMVNGSNTGDSMSNGSFTQSPTMSWASVESSRPSSPEQQLATPNHVVSHNKRPRPTRKHSVPMHRKAKFIASSDRRTTTTSNDNVIADEVISKTTAATDNSNRKRKRRARQTKPKVKPTSFSCDVPDCGKVFSRAYNLTSHMKTHSAERPFVCGSCPLAFARRHDRERHVRLHTGEKPYSCQSCGSGFMRNDALHRHQRICGQSVSALVAMLQHTNNNQQVEGSSINSLALDGSSGVPPSNIYQTIFDL